LKDKQESPRELLKSRKKKLNSSQDKKLEDWKEKLLIRNNENSWQNRNE